MWRRRRWGRMTCGVPPPGWRAGGRRSLLLGAAPGVCVSCLTTRPPLHCAATMLESMRAPATPRLEATFPSASPEALDLLRKLLHFNPDKRISPEEALRHPYCAQVRPPGHPLCQHGAALPCMVVAVICGASASLPAEPTGKKLWAVACAVCHCNTFVGCPFLSAVPQPARRAHCARHHHHTN